MDLHKIIKKGDKVNRRRMDGSRKMLHDDMEYEVESIARNELVEIMIWITRPGWGEKIFYFSWQFDKLFKAKSLVKLLKKL